MNGIQTTPRVSHEKNLIKDILPIEIDIYEEINLQVKSNLIKQKLEPLIEKLKNRWNYRRKFCQKY